MKPVLFIHIPRTAGTSTWQGLTIAADNAGRDVLNYGRKPLLGLNLKTSHVVTFKHISIPVLLQYGVLDPQWFESAKVFSVVRNPWSRMVSLWGAFFKNMRKHAILRRYWKCREFSSKKNDRVSFEQYVHIVTETDLPPVGPYIVVGMNYANPQVDWLTDETKVFRFESLAEQWKDILSYCELPTCPELPVTNAAKHGSPYAASYQQFYNPQTRELVRKHFAEDIGRFGYSF